MVMAFSLSSNNIKQQTSKFAYDEAIEFAVWINLAHTLTDESIKNVFKLSNTVAKVFRIFIADF